MMIENLDVEYEGFVEIYNPELRCSTCDTEVFEMDAVDGVVTCEGCGRKINLWVAAETFN